MCFLSLLATFHHHYATIIVEKKTYTWIVESLKISGRQAATATTTRKENKRKMEISKQEQFESKMKKSVERSAVVVIVAVIYAI